MVRIIAFFALAASFAAALPTTAQHASHKGNVAVNGPGTGSPSEPGDAAFAAIAEIVALLSADETTDWSSVDIDALREHLVDMNQLVTGVRVRTEPVANGLTMRIDTAGRAGEAATRMVPAHGPVLAAETGWGSDVSTDGGEIVWTVTGDASSVKRIQALGFFGLMATGDHHHAHHIALVLGESAH